MDKSEKPLINRDSPPSSPKEQSGWLKQLILGFEITTTVFSFLVIIFQFALAISFGDSADQLKGTKSYQYILNNIINYEMMYDITFAKNETDGSVKCPDSNRPLKFKEIESVNNTCIETKDSITVLRFEKNCRNIKTYTNTKYISEIFGQQMCYQTFPKNYFIYYFRVITEKCELTDFTCGQTKTMLICLKRRQEITTCPLIDFSFIENIYDKEVLSNIIGPIPKLSRHIMVKNFTTINNPYLSFKITAETFNEINFYDYFKKNKEIYPTYESAFFKYYDQFYALTNSIELNENFNGRISDSRNNLFDVDVYKFFNNFDISETPDLNFLYQTISANKNIHFRISYFPIPTDKCIKYFFIDDKEANTRGLFSVLTDLSFEFLYSNIQYYVTWNFIQIMAFFVFSFKYRVISLSGKINKTLSDMDRKYEKLTLITLKFFYYISLMMKYLTIFNVKIMLNGKLDFIKQLVDMECFKFYSEFDSSESLIHLNLIKLYNEVSFEHLNIKFNIILYLTIIDIGNEGMSILFIVLDMVFKIL